MKKKYIIALFVLFVTLAACNKSDQTKQVVIRLRSERMNLDICNSVADSTDLKGWKLVIYTDSTVCSSCRTSDFPQWKVLLKPFEKRDVSTLFIFRPRYSQLHSFCHLLNAHKKDAKVVVDSTGLFRLLNPQIPDNTELHSFLVNKKNQVVFVGNPFRSDQVKELMLRIIDETKLKEP